jgi:putative glycosyltransferase (TIGR04372 family)
MERVIDYSRSPFKSEYMDLQLIRHARFFIGTTSGLTNVAVSFGIPCALVNCITTDAQLWHSNVRFAPKIVRCGERMITQSEMTHAPWRWRMFASETLRHHGAAYRDNSDDEILEIVKEVDRLSNAAATMETRPTEALIENWRSRLAFPHFYGAASISRYFLQKHEAEFLWDLPWPVLRMSA